MCLKKVKSPISYDVCVVGAGVFGSCTAYHLSKFPNLKICLVGPGEPEKKSRKEAVFGCHYDEGRITRVVSDVKTDQLLAYRSTLKYSQLERESGLKIFSEVGFGIVGVLSGAYAIEVKTGDEFCENNGIDYEILDEKSASEKWSYFVPPKNFTGRFVGKLSGYLSIRNLIRATQVVATKNGVHYKEIVATSVHKIGDMFQIKLADDTIINSKKIVLACGSFINFFDFPLQNPLHLDLIGHSVMKFEVSEEDYQLTKDFPSMNYRHDPNNGDIYLYILPPIQYPNGKYYIKLGHTVNYPEEGLEQSLGTLEEVKDWYCMEDYTPARDHFTKYFAQMFPSIVPLSLQLDHCAMALTKTGKQYIGFDSENVLVAAGGNGVSAKMGLEIGNICANSIVKGEWDYDLDEMDFRIVYKK